MPSQNEPEPKERERPLIENEDYYFDNGLMVLTAHFLKQRGYCCGNNCRHCPYGAEERAAVQRRNSSSSL